MTNLMWFHTVDQVFPQVDGWVVIVVVDVDKDATIFILNIEAVRTDRWVTRLKDRSILLKS